VSAPTIVGLAIPADESQPVTVVALPATLAGVRQHVGRPADRPHMEALHLHVLGWTYLWLDEDGRAKGLEPNPRASILGATTGRLGADRIVGDVLVMGSNSSGEDQSLDVATLARLSRLLGVEVSA
jgi:hypothetical protein